MYRSCWADYEDLAEALLRPSEQTAKHMILQFAQERVERSTYQAMQSSIHNLNTMNSRAGAQVPFTSINYGTVLRMPLAWW